MFDYPITPGDVITWAATLTFAAICVLAVLYLGKLFVDWCNGKA